MRSGGPGVAGGSAGWLSSAGSTARARSTGGVLREEGRRPACAELGSPSAEPGREADRLVADPAEKDHGEDLIDADDAATAREPLPRLLELELGRAVDGCRLVEVARAAEAEEDPLLEGLLRH